MGIKFTNSFMKAPSGLCIAMITDDFSPAKTGVGVHVQKITEELTKKGHRVVVVTCRKPGQSSFEKKDLLTVYRTTTITIADFPQALPTKSQLHRIFLDENVTIVHFHYLSQMMLRGIEVSRSMGLPTIYTAHMSVDLLLQPVFMKPLRPLLTRLYFNILEKIDHILCPSEVQTRQFNQFTAHPKVHRISNPIEFPGNEEPGTGHPERFVVFYAGRLSPEKNLFYMIDVFEQFSKTEPRAELWIAGQGIMEPALKKTVAERGLGNKIFFKGHIPHEQLPEIYQSCDVFFLPSLKEVLALVALEAMRYSRPVLVTDRIICARELVDDGNNGWIVDASNPADAAEKLLRLSRDQDLAFSMGRKGYLKSLGYTLPEIVKNLESLYDGISRELPDSVDQPIARRRLVCVFCDRGTFNHSLDSNVLQADSRNLPDEFFRLWRCSICQSLHSLVYAESKDFNRPSPFLKRKLNPFNRKMFEGFYRFLVQQGIKPLDRMLFYGLSSTLFKTIFEEMGHSPVTIVENILSDDDLAKSPEGIYDVAVIMEYLECAENPAPVFNYVYRRLKPDGLLVVHTPNAKKITLDLSASERLHQPHRIHIISDLMLESLSRRKGFKTVKIIHRNYMDTFWPFINFHAFHDLAKFGDRTLDAAIEFNPRQFIKAWWLWPRYLFWGLFGGLLPDRSNMIGVLRKEYIKE